MYQLRKPCDRLLPDSWFSFYQTEYPQYQFKLASLDDLSAIVHLERYCFNPFIAFERRRWRYLISRSVCSVLLVYDNQTLVAYLCLFPHAGWHGVEIRSLAVHWHYRRQGLGRILMRCAETFAGQQNFRSLYLSVDCVNEPAFLLYQHYGFQIKTRVKDYYGQERDAYRMRLSVDDIDR